MNLGRNLALQGLALTGLANPAPTSDGEGGF